MQYAFVNNGQHFGYEVSKLELITQVQIREYQSVISRTQRDLNITPLFSAYAVLCVSVEFLGRTKVKEVFRFWEPNTNSHEVWAVTFFISYSHFPVIQWAL